MTEHDKPVALPSDFIVSLGLLTRLPVRLDPDLALRRGARAAWAWPLVGALIGLAGGLAGWAANGLGLPPGMSAGLVLVVMIMLTGAMHEDGLADMADGFWGGSDPEARLEIMKDSRTGAFAVIALGLSLILRWSALTSLIAAGSLILPLMAAASLSRVPMVALMAALPNARGKGLANAVGRPPRNTTLLAGGMALLLGFILIGWPVIPTAFWIAVAVVLLAAVARAKIGGQTGDVLGASQQIAEIVALAILAGSVL